MSQEHRGATPSRTNDEQRAVELAERIRFAPLASKGELLKLSSAVISLADKVRDLRSPAEEPKCDDCGFPMTRGILDRSGQEWSCLVCSKSDIRLSENKRLREELAKAEARLSETGTLDMSEKARLKDAEDDVLRLHGEKMKLFERVIVLERELATMTRDRDARAREACTAEGRTGCSFALSATEQKNAAPQGAASGGVSQVPARVAGALATAGVSDEAGPTGGPASAAPSGEIYPYNPTALAPHSRDDKWESLCPVEGFNIRWLSPSGFCPVDIQTTGVLLREINRLRGEVTKNFHARSSVAANKDEPSELVKRISAYSYADADAVAKLEREAAEWKRKFYGEAVDRAPRSATAMPAGWKLVCEKCGADTNGPCGWPTACDAVQLPSSYVSHKGSKT